MVDEEKTVFISYRRNVSAFVARSIFMDLREHGYDVFMDVESIDSGTFDTIILNQIAARAHFLIILTPGSAERLDEPGDWLRREIEHAIDLKRNIVPVLANDFKFGNYKRYFTGRLSKLPRYNALTVPYDFFDAAMDKLRTRFLRMPVAVTIHQPPPHEHPIIERKIEKAANMPASTETQLKREVDLEIRQRQEEPKPESELPIKSELKSEPVTPPTPKKKEPATRQPSVEPKGTTTTEAAPPEQPQPKPPEPKPKKEVIPPQPKKKEPAIHQSLVEPKGTTTTEAAPPIQPQPKPPEPKPKEEVISPKPKTLLMRI